MQDAFQNMGSKSKEVNFGPVRDWLAEANALIDTMIAFQHCSDPA